jgi:uncharacterized protein (TIGR03437 family)
MKTTSRVASARFTPFLLIAFLLALGCFDTAQAQNLTVSATALTFSTSPGINPMVQAVTVGSTGSTSYNITSSEPWVSAAPDGSFGSSSGTAPDTLAVTVVSSSMASGTYTATITLTPTNGSPAVTIAVTLVISGAGNTGFVLTPSLTNLYFAVEIGQAAPAAQTVQVVSSGGALPVSMSLTETASPTCPQGWLQANLSATTTPFTLSASVLPTGLGAGTCGGSITLTSTTTANGTTTVVIPVLVFISPSAVLQVAIPAGLTSVTLKQGADPAVFMIPITSSNPAVPLSFTAAASMAPWLAAPVPSSGQTPNSLYIQITPGTQIKAGTYSGSITITANTIFNGSLTIPITFTLLPGNSVTVSPAGTQNFTEQQGGALPAPQTLTLSGSSAATYTATVTPVTGGAWLQANPTSGSIIPNSSGTALTLSVAPNSLTQGTYSSQVTLTFVPSTIPPITVLVSLTVGPPAAALTAIPSSLSFSYQFGGMVPASQVVTVTAPSNGSAFTVGSISQSWIAVAANTSVTPASLSVSVTPAGLQPGMYSGSFTVTSGGLTLMVPVSLMIAGTTSPQIFLLGNNSSGVGGQVAPGEIIAIEGSGLGPATGVTGSSSLLQNVSVTFSGVPGTLLYVSASQIDVVVPYEVAGRASTVMVVSYQGVPSSSMTLPVVSAALGLSTISQTGSGQAAALNQNYSLNGPSNPAPEGSYISLYGTGGGQTNPGSLDGEVSSLSTLLPLVLQPYVTATIGGKNAPVLFAGAAPGLITGVTQIDLQVPTGVTGPALPVVITITMGSTVIQSQSGVTVAVQ